MNSFKLIPANSFIWNHCEFLQFLIDNQGQPIELSTNNEGVCLTSSGVYRLLEQFRYTDVTIYTNNLLEQHSQFHIKRMSPFNLFKISHSEYTHLHKWNQKKIFGCFYNRPLWHRIGLAAVLQHDYNALINVRTSTNTNDARAIFELAQLFEYHPESFFKFSKVVNTWPITVEDTDGYTMNNNTTGHTDQLARFYTEFLIDVVAETWIHGNTFYPTEKTVRPMLLKKPMIIMGSRDYLDYLHQMGFKTFCNYWSEDYDGYNNQNRYIKILQVIDNISKKSIIELNYMYQDMQYILDHNYNLLKNQNYKKQITQIT